MIQDYFLPGFEIKRATQTSNGGIVEESYSTIATVEGRMRPLSGSEIMRNEKNNYITTHRFYCNVIDLNENDVICKDGKTYEVKLKVNPMEMNEFLQVDCECKEDS